MSEKYTFATASEALPFIASRILDIGDEVGSRNGRTKELLNTQIVLTDPQRREILTVNRKANVFAQIAETMWVLAGRNDIEWLGAYLPRAKDYSDDGEVWRGGYGPRLRGGYFGFDQLQHVVSLLKNDPLSRRAVIAIYEPTTDASPGKDIPCNDFLQFQSRLGALHLTVTVRSNDLMWGWSGINAFEWSTLQEMVASMLGITVGTLTFNIGSLHIYEPHWSKAERLEFEDLPHAITPFDPNKTITTIEDLDALIEQWFAFEAMCRTGQVSKNDFYKFNEPLVQSWAAAIAYYWTRDEGWLGFLDGTGLAVAVARTPASVLSEAPVASDSGAGAPGHNLAAHERSGAFYGFVADLHAKKHASYGNSWKKRGEKMSILANMARKADRLGVGDEYDTSADTLIDLLVYAIKYHCWLLDCEADPVNVDQGLAVALAEVEEVSTEGEALDITYADILHDFDRYCDLIDALPLDQKIDYVSELIIKLAPIARDVWHAEQQNAQIDKIHGPGAAAALEAAIQDGSVFNDEYKGADHE